MNARSVGEFEQLVMLAILRLGDDVYGVPIVREIERRTGRAVARAAVYVALRRLERKGFVSSWLGEPMPERGGKPRRYVRVETEGLDRLRQSTTALAQMCEGLESVLEAPVRATPSG